MEAEPADGDERDPEEIKKELEKADPSEPRLKPITDDAPVKGGAPSWTVRHYGDKDTYRNANPLMSSVNYGVVIARSLQWPGAYNFFSQGRWMHFYVGDGHKFESTTFYPVFPPEVCSDPEERPTFDEPNPREEPVVEGVEQNPEDEEPVDDE
jgi:hypothetical protein